MFPVMRFVANILMHMPSLFWKGLYKYTLLADSMNINMGQ